MSGGPQLAKWAPHRPLAPRPHRPPCGASPQEETYLHLVMDFLPETLRSVVLQHHKRRKRFAIDHVKAYVYQARGVELGWGGRGTRLGLGPGPGEVSTSTSARGGEAGVRVGV